MNKEKNVKEFEYYIKTIRLLENGTEKQLERIYHFVKGYLGVENGGTK